MLHLAGRPGQDTGPLGHNRITTVTITAAPTIVVSKYHDASA
jgi:hypothetical protein